MLTGNNGDDVAFTERKQVGKRDTFTTEDPVAIRKSGCYRHYCIAAERAALGI